MLHKFTCLFFCGVAVTVTGVYVIIVLSCLLFSGKASENGGSASIKNLDIVLLECATKHEVPYDELETAIVIDNVALVNSCFWACCFRKAGFLDNKGQYVLEPGLTYFRNIVKRDDVYTNVENVAKQCESVNDKFVSDGSAGCGRGLLIAACFLEQIYQLRFFSKTYNYYGD